MPGFSSTVVFVIWGRSSQTYCKHKHLQLGSSQGYLSHSLGPVLVQKKLAWRKPPLQRKSVTCSDFADYFHKQKTRTRTVTITQWVKALATNSDDLSLIPRIYMVEGENQLLPSSGALACVCSPSPTCINKQMKEM